MTLEIRDDTRRGWIRVRACGSLSVAEVVRLIRTARATVADQMRPMLFDATGATTTMTEADVDDAVAAVRDALRSGPRGHVAMIADDDVLFARMLLYEMRCAEVGATTIRAFRQVGDAERWLEIVSAARHLR